jgi:hypothetical protein
MNLLKKINLIENQRPQFNYLFSLISWSTILLGVERHFQLYRGGGNYRPNAKSLTNVFQR